MAHNRPTGKNAPGTAPAEKPLSEAEKQRVMEAGGAVTAGALYGWLNARYPSVEVSPETKARLVKLAAELSEAPGMLGAMARGALNGWMCQEFADMGARFAAQAKAKEDADAAAPPKCHSCGFAICGCDPWRGYK